MDFITNLLSLAWALLWTKEAFWLVVGLLVGWNILPQPTWVKGLVVKVLPKKVTSPE
jgi:hypothetical protein